MKNIQNSFDSLRSNSLLEILDCLSILKLQHSKLCLRISEKIQNSKEFYEKNIPDIIFNYGN